MVLFLSQVLYQSISRLIRYTRAKTMVWGIFPHFIKILPISLFIKTGIPIFTLTGKK